MRRNRRGGDGIERKEMETKDEDGKYRKIKKMMRN